MLNAIPPLIAKRIADTIIHIIQDRRVAQLEGGTSETVDQATDTERLRLRILNAQLGLPVTHLPHVYIRALEPLAIRQSPHSFLLD